jgi:PAS domain S-box-containing protein
VQPVADAFGERLGVERSHSVVSRSWVEFAKLAVGLGVVYFLAARISFVLRVEPGVVVFWPAAGIAAGALIALGPKARLPIATGAFIATVAHNVMAGRNPWLIIAFSLVSAGHPLLMAWLIERWFGGRFKLEDVWRALGFFTATAIGAAVAAVGATAAIKLVEPTVSPLYIWCVWFASSSLGIVTVTPLLIGLADAERERLPRQALIEGSVGLVAITVLIASLISLPNGLWATALPEALVFPLLLWIAIRCRPIFAAAAALAVGLTVIGSTTLNIGYFDWGNPLTDRILSAQIFVLTEAILAVLMAAVFAERRRAQASLADALAAGQVMAFEWNALSCQSRRSNNSSLILGDDRLGTEFRRSQFLNRVHPEDRQGVKTLIRELQPGTPSYALTFRYVRPDGQQLWLEERAKGEFDTNGRLLRIKGLTRDITDQKKAELALAERNAQLGLAGRAARVGSYAYDVEKGTMQISEGYAAIHGLPLGMIETSYNEWRMRVHPDDLKMAEGTREEAFAIGSKEDNAEYRIVLSTGEVRWIERRGWISYSENGRPERVVGVNIDVTGRKRAEERQRVLLAELDHRVKNTLATVSSVVSQTAVGSTSVTNFVKALDGRIRSMATTHELLSFGRWRGVSLTELVRQELAPYATRHNTKISGPEVVLRPEAGQAIAMVLHELATNAAKYGALSTKQGRVSIRWEQPLNGYPLRLALEWQEFDGPQVVAPGKAGFGMSTIRDLIPYEFGGSVDLAFVSAGVQCRLELPANWLTHSSEGSSSNGVHPFPR